MNKNDFTGPAHGPCRKTTEWDEMFLLCVSLESQLQLRVDTPQIAEKIRHEVIDNICLVALPQCVQVNSSSFES